MFIKKGKDIMAVVCWATTCLHSVVVGDSQENDNSSVVTEMK